MKRLGFVAGFLIVMCAPSGAQTVAPAPLSLGDAIREAISRNAAVVAASRNVDVAQARRTQVALPPVQLQPGVSMMPDAPGGVGMLQTVNGTLVQQFPPPGNLAASRSAAEAGIRAAEYGVDIARRDISLRVTSSYYTLAGAQATVDIARQNAASTQDLVRSAELRQRAGVIGSFEVLRTTVELRRVQADLLRAQSAQNTARVNLNTLLARSPNDPTTVQEPQSEATAVPSAAPIPATDLMARAVANDPMLEQLQTQIAEQSARARASEALRRPTFSVGAGYQVARGSRTGAAFAAPLVTGGLSLPLFDRGTISGAIREAQATRTVLEAQRQGRVLDVQAGVAVAVADIDASQARLQFAQASRAQAEEGLRVAQFGFRQGALGSLDVLNAKNAAVSARGEEQQAAADLASARARLSILLGATTSS